MPSKPASTPNPSSSPPNTSPTSSNSSTSTTNATSPPPPKPVISSTISSTVNGRLAAAKQPIDDHYQRPPPASPEARDFVDDLIYCEWTLRRLRAADTQMWRYQSDDRFRDPQKYPLGYAASCNPGTFTKLQYRLDAPRRARVRALQALEKLKAEAAAAPAPVIEPALPAPVPTSLNPSPQTTSPQIGFVLPPTPQAPGPPPPEPPAQLPQAPRLAEAPPDRS